MSSAAETFFFIWVVSCSLMNHDTAWQESSAGLIMVQHVSKEVKSLRFIKIRLLILSLIVIDGRAF